MELKDVNLENDWQLLNMPLILFIFGLIRNLAKGQIMVFGYFTCHRQMGPQINKTAVITICDYGKPRSKRQ